MILKSLVPSAVLMAVLSAGGQLGTLQQAAVTDGSLIKASGPAVYYVGADELRYVFPNDRIFFSWYSGFGGVVTVSDSELAAFRIGGNVTYRPGTRLVKIQSDPKVYAVAKGGVLRWMKTEAAASAIFGSGWNKLVDDLSDSFFVNYTVGADISSSDDYDAAAEQGSALNIDSDKSLSAPGQEQPSSCETANCVLGSACVENACKAVPGPSALMTRLFIVDTLDTCFVGDTCGGGACCSVAGVQFADNANLKAVKPADKYLYADKQQLCGRAGLSSDDRYRIENEFSAFVDGVAQDTANRVTVNNIETRISGQFALSRISGTCNWWLAPSDVSSRLSTQIDSSTDAVFVVSSRTFDFGEVTEPTSQTIDQSAGIGGTGYAYLIKEWNTDIGGAPNPSAFRSAFKSQLASSVDLNITDPAKSYVGNHCRDGKRDLDETGVDCGGSGCNACIY
jgi:hypothetical protein